MYICVDYPPPHLSHFCLLSTQPNSVILRVRYWFALLSSKTGGKARSLWSSWIFSPRTVWSLTIPGDSFGLRNAENKHIFQDLDALAIAMSLKCLSCIWDRCWLSEGPPTKHFGKLFSASQWPIAGQPLLSACSRPPTGSRRTIQILETGL